MMELYYKMMNLLFGYKKPGKIKKFRTELINE